MPHLFLAKGLQLLNAYLVLYCGLLTDSIVTFAFHFRHIFAFYQIVVESMAHQEGKLQLTA